MGDDGIQNVLYCADPLFYDISYVGNNPASKLAAALLRVASPDASSSLAETLKITRICHYSSSSVLGALRKAECDMSEEEVASSKASFAPDPSDREAPPIRP